MPLSCPASSSSFLLSSSPTVRSSPILISPLHGIRSPPLPWKSSCFTLSIERAATVQQCRRIWHQGSPTAHNPRFLVPLSQRISSYSSSSFSGMLASVVLLMALGTKLEPLPPGDPFNSMPPNLSGSEKLQRVQRPKSPKAERCTQKCVTTCIRGGAGSPGEGPLNIRRPLVVFKEGFRTRQYCLVECSDICNLIGDGDDGP